MGFCLLAGGSRALSEMARGEGRTFLVPAEFPSVQEALTAAQDGDTVLVTPGEYIFSEPLTFAGKAIRLESEAGPKETTLRIRATAMAGAQRASVIIFESGEPPNAAVRGFTITGGFGTSAWLECDQDIDSVGGGVAVLGGSSAIIEDCIITGNKAEQGAGVACLGGSVTLRDCKVDENQSGVFDPVTSSGGLLCLDGATALLERCSLSRNKALTGAGLTLSCGSKVVARACAIDENETSEDGAVGGIACGDAELILEDSSVSKNCRRGCEVIGGIAVTGESHAEIVNCRIEGNHAVAYGGGITVRSGAVVYISNSWIASNSSEESGGIDCGEGYVIVEASVLSRNGGGTGGILLTANAVLDLSNSLIVRNRYCGMDLNGASRSTITNCTIADNCQIGLTVAPTAHLTLRNSILWGNGDQRCFGGFDLYCSGESCDVTHSLVGGDGILRGEGNLNADPLFRDSAAEDYHLVVSSPAIDAGVSAATPDRDLDGHARLCGDRVDLGAFEFGECELKRFRRGDTDGSGSLELTDAVWILRYLFLGKPELSCLDAADTEDDGQLDVADAVYLLRSLFLGGAPPPEPSDACGVDPTADTVSCSQDLGCRG